VPDLTTEQTTLALAIIGGVALLAFLFAAISLFRLRKARKEYMILRGDGPERDVLAAVGRTMKRVDAMNTRIDSLALSQEEQASISRFAVQRFALVRYDAFDDMGGQLSFSAALLDDHGDGLLITSINGRTETRTYAKPIKQLTSPHNLSDEEREAISAAAAGEARGTSRAAATAINE
jgi:hypothetical protein